MGMGKMFRSRTRAEEKEDSRFYHVLEGDISEIRRRLKVMYLAEEGGHEDEIHRMVVRLDRIDSSLSDYLFDGESARQIMETMDKH
jgi:hypothetical protein